MPTVWPVKKIEALLNPQSVALVGASDRPGHWSKRVWDNLHRFGYAGGVFPVNPNRKELWGSRCFATLDALPQRPDHLAIFTPAETTLEVLRQGIAVGSRSATIYAAGFGEGGDTEGRVLATQLRQLLSDGGLTAVGPNCMGVASGRSNFTTIPDETLQEFAPSPIAVVSQSGAMCATINRALNHLGHKIGLLVSCGNQIGCTIGDVIDYCADQPELRVVLCYIESIPDADRFLTAVRRARHNGKAIVAVKIGGSEEARASALAHTGALAGRSEVFDVFASAAGLIHFGSLEDALEAVEFLARSPMPRGDRVALMTISGAVRSLMMEGAQRTGLRLSRFSADTRQALSKTLGITIADNPLDTRRTLPSDQYAGCLDVLVNASEVDMLLVAEEFPRVAGVERRVANLRMLDRAASSARAAGKPVAIVMPLTTGMSDYGWTVRNEMPHVPVMHETEKALRVAQAIGAATVRPLWEGEFFAPPKLTGQADIWRSWAMSLERPTALNEVESKKILQAYGITLPPEAYVQNADEAVQAADDIGFPIVLKAVCGAVPHKSDAGLVILGVRDADAVREGVATLRSRCASLDARMEGILVVRHVSGGIETVLGVSRDPEMGPVLMFGAGGIWIELVKDARFAPPWLDREQAAALVKSTRVARLLGGFRGSKPCDDDALCEALVHLGQMARDLGDIIEAVDINPFLVRERGQGACALDALVVLRPPITATLS
jgi:acyl-CoA synthetase (NDP forming)